MIIMPPMFFPSSNGHDPTPKEPIIAFLVAVLIVCVGFFAMDIIITWITEADEDNARTLLVVAVSKIKFILNLKLF